MAAIIRNRDLYGTVLACISATMFGFLGLLGTKLVQHDFAVTNMLFWRFTVATLWMLGAVFIARKHLIANVTFKSALHILIEAAILYSASSACFFLSAGAIGTGLAMAIFFSFPLFVTAFTCIFNGWRIDKFTASALCAIFIGITLINGVDVSSASLTGVFFAVAAAILYAAYVYRSRHVSNQVDPYYLTLLVCFGNMLIFFIVSYSTNHFSIPHTLSDWVYIATLGIFATALPIQLLLESMKYISAVKASILTSLEVVVMLTLGWLFLDEHATLSQIAGVTIILFGAIMSQCKFASPTDDLAEAS